MTISCEATEGDWVVVEIRRRLKTAESIEPKRNALWRLISVDKESLTGRRNDVVRNRACCFGKSSAVEASLYGASVRWLGNGMEGAILVCLQMRIDQSIGLGSVNRPGGWYRWIRFDEFVGHFEVCFISRFVVQTRRRGWANEVSGNGINSVAQVIAVSVRRAVQVPRSRQQSQSDVWKRRPSRSIESRRADRSSDTVVQSGGRKTKSSAVTRVRSFRCCCCHSERANQVTRKADSTRLLQRTFDR